MEWWRLVLTAVFWLLGSIVLYAGIRITQENHRNKSVFDHAERFPAFGHDSIIGMIAGLVTSVIYGILMKYSPWWLAKTLLVLIACLLFYWGVIVSIKLIH